MGLGHRHTSHTHRHDPHSHDHAHDHGHAPPHHHEHGHHIPASGRAFVISLILNGGYGLVQIGFGIKAHSLALIADAVHNLGDMLALSAAWAALWLGQRKPTARYTYGFGSSSILVTLGSAIFLLLMTGGIAWQSLQRFITPQPVMGKMVLLIALVGIAVNGGSAALFLTDRKQDLNKRAAFQHLLADAAVTLGVVLAGGLMMATGWLWLDPVAGLAISGTIIYTTWVLLCEAMQLAMQGVPPAINHSAVAVWLAEQPGVASVHDLHIWALSTTQTALTVHLVCGGDMENKDQLIDDVAAGLERRFGIRHATVQIESGHHAHICHRACDTEHEA